MTTPAHVVADRDPLVAAVSHPCPRHGGPPVPPAPYVTFRACPGGPALIVAGAVVAHLGPGEAVSLGGALTVAGRVA